MERLPIRIQRLEGLAIAATAVIFIHQGFAWWWLLVLFLALDLSMIGYAHSARVGALSYNLGHNYVGPVLLIGVGAFAELPWAWFVALAWAFHVGTDRALGYGLKLPDSFAHTHLGTIGPARRAPA